MNKLARERDDASTNAVRGRGGPDETWDSDAPTHVWFFTTDAPPSSAKLPFHEGTRYARGEILGRGAMGAVHLCGDRRLERDVAMKFIRPEHADDASLRLRFLREARIQGGLEHPGIVPVYDLGVGADGVPYFTMKRVQGRSLRSVLDALQRGDTSTTERFTRRRLLEAFGTICLTVAFAHSRGVIHRDIKPSNVMLGEFGEVYLLDWGIAKVVPRASQDLGLTCPGASLSDADDSHDGTARGALLGTPGFIAPEMLRGETADERTDIYALGATLFEILSLVPLHPRAPHEAVASTLRGADARISRRAPSRSVEPDLEDLCVRATALDPAQRPASVREMHDVVEQVLDGFRDVERAREMSAQHATRAVRELERARRGAPEARETAFHEVHRAVALDPANQKAIAVLRKLASERDDLTQATASRVVGLSTHRSQAMLERLTLVFFTPWMGAIAALAFLDVRSSWPLAINVVLVSAAAALTWVRSRSDRVGLAMAALALADAAAAFGGCAFGPFVLVPGLLACTTLTYAMVMSLERRRLQRGFAIASALVAFLVPLVLEWTGVLPPSVVVEKDAIVLLPRAIGFPAGWALAFLVVANAALILLPALIACRAREQAARAEQRALEAAARMRQMLPGLARAVMPSRSGWTPFVGGSAPRSATGG